METKNHEITDINQIKKNIFAGKCTVTLESGKTGKWFTYKIKADKKNDKLFFVSLLTNPETYSYIGIITDVFKHTKNSKVSADTDSFKAFNFFYSNLLKDIKHVDLHIYHDGTCARCGRKLTTPESVQMGIGPECAKKS